MELIILSVVIVVGFAAYLYFIKSKSIDGSEKNYYYNRFLRNKKQLESFIEKLGQLILAHKCGGDFVTNGITLEVYLNNMINDYEINYANSILKILKRNKLKNKEKRYYRQILNNQSEQLYNVETEINALHSKYRSLAVF